MRRVTGWKRFVGRAAKSTLTWDGRVPAEDALDMRLIRQARQSDRGKERFSVNELRAQRGLAAI